MADEKKVKADPEKKAVVSSGIASYKAKEGHILPLFLTSGKLVYVGSKEPTELDVSKVKYFSKVELDRALKLGYIEKI